MNREELIALANKILKGEASEAEVGQYNTWYNAMQQGEDFDILDSGLKRAAIYAKVESIIDSRHHVIDIKTRRLWPRIAAVAAAVTAIALCTYFFTVSRPGDKSDLLTYAKNDIAPGKSGATIELGDGRVIQLSGAKTGVVIGNGSIVYSSLRASKATKQSPLHDEIASIPSNDVMQMTASTAKGQTYQFTLPDGTRVWLNADSKIEFPSQFNGEDRKVLLSGEAYFAVVHNAKQPFKVESKGAGRNGQIVEDIGTEFNINAYPDEMGVRTTLIEGSASVSSLREEEHELPALRRRVTAQPRVLTQNQQAIWFDGTIKVSSANVEEAISWKNGHFRFNDEQLGSIMKKLGRWYDIEVVFGDLKVAQVGFTGTISRDKNISQILSMLEKTKGVHFKIEGRRIIVNE